MRVIFFVVLTLLSSVAQAQNRQWTAVNVPNASCGSGEPYSVFISPGSSDDVAIAFQGGGACWSYDSCFGWIKLTDLSAPKSVTESGGIFSLNPLKSPVSGATMIYLPYCTGDVHAGRHVAQYKRETVYHSGRTNVESALQVLSQNYGSVFQSAKRLTVYGYSAGAIGAMVHLRALDRLFRAIPEKRAILDSPGLHWGDTFWHKFTPELVSDYSDALTQTGLTFDVNSGLIAEIIPRLCGDLFDWNIGVIQSTRDRVMSLVFGDISSGDHENLVLGPGGVFSLTMNPLDNCSSWNPPVGTHVFLAGNKSGSTQLDGLTAFDFASRVISGLSVPSFK